jgi:ribosome-associated protein
LENLSDNSGSTKTLEFRIKGEYVELCNLLKLVGIAESGGRGKALVAEGAVKVDGRPESRKTAKIRAGQVVECSGIEIKVGS